MLATEECCFACRVICRALSCGFLLEGMLGRGSERPKGSDVVVESCVKHCKDAARRTHFSFSLFLLVGLLTGAAFNPFVFAEVIHLRQ